MDFEPGHSERQPNNLAAMRAEVAELTRQVAEAAAKRGAALKDSAVQGIDAGARSSARLIRDQPIPALGVAFLAGAALAILLTPSRPSSAFDGFSRDVRQYADRSVAAARSSVAPVLPAMERLVEQVAGMSTTSLPLERIGAIWRSLTKG